MTLSTARMYKSIVFVLMALSGPLCSLLFALYFISYPYNDSIRQRFLVKFSRELPEAYRGKLILPKLHSLFVVVL